MPHGSAAESQWVYRGATGRLIYAPDAEGDRILDFSGVGYQRGRVEIPLASIAVTVGPSAGDDTAAIQSAIDQVSQMPLGSDGFRGAVLLEAGDYQISGQLKIQASGVVLRGSGNGASETVLHATGTSQRDLIQIAGGGSQSLTGSTRNMIDKTVPVGATSFRVDSTIGFSVGDTVRITRPSTAEWISDIGMDMIPPRTDGAPISQWEPGSRDIRFDRVITRIEGDRVFIDAPLANSFEQNYGGGTIKRYTWADRIENVGVENLRAESEFASDVDEDHSWNFVSIDKAQHVWVRDTVSAYFAGSAVVSNPEAKWVTVDNAVNLDPKSEITGTRRYTFDLSGQLELVTNSQANDGRHDFVNNSTRPAGPHVFHNSVANNALADSGPHQRWATGSLFDNVTVDGNQINARNRGNFGTGHGWSGANMVIWNSTAESYIVQNPPTAQNWLVGSTGQILDDQTFGLQPAGYVDSPNQPVSIDSLYESQLAGALDVSVFHWSGADALWDDPAAWDEQLTPGGYSLESRDYLVGDIDDFVNDGAGSVDNAYVDSGWETFVGESTQQPVVGFDDVQGGRSVAFTVQHLLGPGERVIHGSLALALKQAGAAAGTTFVRVIDDSPEHQFALDALGWDAALAGANTHVGVLDLGPLAPLMQTGEFSVQVSDGAAVDWASYVVTVATPLASSAGAKVVVQGPGAAIVEAAVPMVADLTIGGDAPGAVSIGSGGAIAVSGDYTQASNGELIVSLGGAAAGDFARLVVVGNATLDGQLSVVLDEDYAPAVGDSFLLIDFQGDSYGAFSSVNVAALPEGLGWRLTYPTIGALLEFVLQGDYNNDGSVDAADYALWRNLLGDTHNLAADGDNSGVIDAGDYQVWRDHYGLTAADLGRDLATGAPEPSTAFFAGLALGAPLFFPTRMTGV